MNGTIKEEEMQSKIEDMQKQIKEKESIAEKKVEENFTLKQKVDD